MVRSFLKASGPCVQHSVEVYCSVCQCTVTSLGYRFYRHGKCFRKEIQLDTVVRLIFVQLCIK